MVMSSTNLRRRHLSMAENTRLRAIEPSDLPALFAMQSDPESSQMAGTKPRTREAYFAAWERNFVDPGVNARVIEVDGEHGPEAVGVVSRFQAEGHDCVGYWIARAHWGNGIASRAVALFLGEEPRRPLYATAASSNAASRHILLGCGFRLTGLHMGEETDRYVAKEVANYVLD